MIQIGGVYTTFCQEEGILLQKYRDRNGTCIAILFKSIGVRGRFDSPESENNSDHPHPPYLQKICPKNMPHNGGLYGIKVGSNQGISTENMAYGPQIWHTDPPVYATRTNFMGGGGGL